MANNDDFWDDLAKVGLILGSIWLGSEFLKAFSDKKKNEDSGEHVDV